MALAPVRVLKSAVILALDLARIAPGQLMVVLAIITVCWSTAVQRH